MTKSFLLFLLVLFFNRTMAQADTARIHELIKTGSQYLLKPGEEKNDLDSALLLTSRARELSRQAHYAAGEEDAGRWIGQIYVEAGKFREAVEWLATLSDTSRILVMKQMLLYKIKPSRDEQRYADTALWYAQKAVALKESALRPEIWYNAYLNLAYCYDLTGNQAEVEKACLKLIDLEKRFGFTDIRPIISISTFYKEKGDLPKALFYSLEAVKIVEKSGNPDLATEPYYMTGTNYYILRKFDLASAYFEATLDLLRKKKERPGGALLNYYAYCLIGKHKTKEAVSMLLEYTAPVYWSTYGLWEQRMIMGTLGTCYAILKMFKEAEHYAQESLAIAKKMNNRNEMVYSLTQLGIIYQEMKDYAKVEYYLHDLAEDTVPGHLSIDYRMAVEELLYRADTGLKQYDKAIQHLIKKQDLQSQVINTKNNQQIEELKMKYDTEKKDERIAGLAKEEQQSRVIRNVLTAAGVLLVFLLVVLFSRYRIKQKSNRRLQEQQEKINATNLQLQQLNQQQQRLLTEKEWLLKEVHHRVKNNLQIVISLLNMQTDYLSDEFAVNAFGEIGHRIQAISLIHQKLYQVADMTVINMPDYIRQLVQFLEESIVEGQQINFDLQVEPIDLEVSQSVPVGLVLNEAITNSIKHAFPGRNGGRISISMKKAGEDMILLEIADNGIGFSPSFDMEHYDSMGLELVKTLVEQLEGTLTIQGDNGFFMSILFRQQKSIFERELSAELTQV